jgi:hypothetical protein
MTGRDLVEVGGDVVVRGGVVFVEGLDTEGLWEDALAPGCSFATSTPMAMVAPVAIRTAARVTRRRRASARPLVSGELNWGAELTGPVLGTASVHASTGA